MTRFIDVADVQELVSSVGVQNFIATLAGYIRDDYLRWQEFDKSPRVANHVPGGVIELMPTSDHTLYGFKYVNGHPKNTAQDLLTVMAFGVLAEIDTGYPLLFSELTISTALRTAATSVFVAKLLARPQSTSMALIGNGAQSEFQTIAFASVLGIKEIRAYDIDPEATAKYIRNMEGMEGIRIVRAASAQEAVRGADIVTTVTADKNYATILTPDMVEPGMHINAVGGDCPGKTELHADILKAAKVFVEFAPQTRIEGDIQQLPADFPVIELWQVLQGVTSARDSAEQVTVFDSVGFAIEDFSTLRYLHDLAEQKNIGSRINLIPAPADPKNLFQFLRQPECLPAETTQARQANAVLTF